MPRLRDARLRYAQYYLTVLTQVEDAYREGGEQLQSGLFTV